MVQVIKLPDSFTEWSEDVECKGCDAHLRVEVHDLSWHGGSAGDDDYFQFTCPACKTDGVLSVSDYSRGLVRAVRGF